MRHPEQDDIALFAISHGTDLAGYTELAEHLVECPECRREVDAYRDVASLVRAGTSSDRADRAPADAGPQVWESIADVLWPGGVGAPDGPLPVSSPVPVSGAPLPADLEALTSVDDDRPHQPPVDLAAERGRRRSRWWPAAAALVVGAALGAGAMAVTRTSDDPDPSRIEATALLDPIPGGPVTDPAATVGSAELISGDNGRSVVVDTQELPAIDGSYEVWLFGDDGRMIALGSLQAGRGQFSVPAGIDTREYRTIDVSDEPADGNPGHSGISVVRGTFS